MPNPVASTASPGAKAGSSDALTVPARSIPATIGNERAIGALPVMPSASL